MSGARENLATLETTEQIDQPRRRQEFWRGVRATFPLVVGAIPFGIIFGTLAGSAGLSAAATMGMSLFVFAGSAQFIAMGLVAAGTVWPKMRRTWVTKL